MESSQQTVRNTGREEFRNSATDEGTGPRDGSIVDLLKSLRDDTLTFVRSEIAAGKREMAENARAAAKGSIAIIAAGASALVALLLLLVGIGVAAGALFVSLGLGPLGAAAAGIVFTAIIIGIASALVISSALKKISAAHFAPTETIARIKKDKEILKENLS